MVKIDIHTRTVATCFIPVYCTFLGGNRLCGAVKAGLGLGSPKGQLVIERTRLKILLDRVQKMSKSCIVHRKDVCGGFKVPRLIYMNCLECQWLSVTDIRAAIRTYTRAAEHWPNKG